jgi:hypothetical protein
MWTLPRRGADIKRNTGKGCSFPIAEAKGISQQRSRRSAVNFLFADDAPGGDGKHLRRYGGSILPPIIFRLRSTLNKSNVWKYT